MEAITKINNNGKIKKQRGRRSKVSSSSSSASESDEDNNNIKNNAPPIFVPTSATSTNPNPILLSPTKKRTKKNQLVKNIVDENEEKIVPTLTTKDVDENNNNNNKTKTIKSSKKKTTPTKKLKRMHIQERQINNSTSDEDEKDEVKIQDDEPEPSSEKLIIQEQEDYEHETTDVEGSPEFILNQDLTTTTTTTTTTSTITPLTLLSPTIPFTDPIATRKVPLILPISKERYTNFIVGATSAIGSRPENQDCYFYGCINNNLNVIGVFDGHGDKGEEVSKLARNIINNHLTGNLKDLNQLDKCIIESFTMADNKLQEYGKKNEIDNGTTATIVVIEKSTGKCTAAWVGDSLAVVIRKKVNDTGSNDGGGDNEKDQWSIVESLTFDHRPDDQEEKIRITESRGRVVYRYGSWRVIPAESDFTEDQLSRQRLALNMSRALGHHVLSRYGICAKPNFASTTLQPGDYLLVASDGLSNAIDYRQLSTIVSSSSQSHNPQRLSQELARKAEQACRAKNTPSDNITICCYPFKGISTNSS